MPREKRISPTFATIPIALITASCALLGGGGPEDRVSNIKHAKNYQTASPTAWTPIDRADSDSAYKTRAGNITTMTSSCDRDATQSLELLTKHLLIGARKIQTVESETMMIDGTEGLYSHVKAQLEGKPFELHLFVTTRKNCIFDFTLMSPKTSTDIEVGEFKSFVRSFRYVP
ncbi:MAG: hypothetical protein HYR96_03655 [Deltaproteobacteria bacterium]|nr:hypothetical protein [Deltaproteobacteria bacterium]MBI3295213.1 hypothetical protein [Deltaproteobacteria bacterium]